MKKLFLTLSIMSLTFLSNAQFQGDLTHETPNLRVKAMGDIYSLIETSNYADFPQRILSGEEGVWLGTDRANSWGLVRYNINNFVDLPRKLSIQISAETMSQVTIVDLFRYVGMPGLPAEGFGPGDDEYDDYIRSLFGNFDEEYESIVLNSFGATNRFNFLLGLGIRDDIETGFGLKLFSNSNSLENLNYKHEHSFWGFESTIGATKHIDSRSFIDAGIEMDVWSWDGKYQDETTNYYETGYLKSEGVYNLGFTARYYNTGLKVDYAPFLKFHYTSLSTSMINEELGPIPGQTVLTKETLDCSSFHFVLGSGIHYKPTENVKVYNDIEFVYQNKGYVSKDNENKIEYSESKMTLIPTFKMGVELKKEIDPKIWWGFNSVQLWGGFNKVFNNMIYNYKSDGNEAEMNNPTFTDSDHETVNVTTGAALQNGNFKVEFYTTVNNLYFNDNALNNVSIGLVYMFTE